jgi:hypothetical protein
MYDQPIGVLSTDTFQSLRLMSDALPLLKPDTIAALVDFSDYIGAARAIQEKAFEKKNRSG